MNLDELLGYEFGETRLAWDLKASVLYAMAIGGLERASAGERYGWVSDDPACFPTMATLAADGQTLRGVRLADGPLAPGSVLYAGHTLELLGSVPPTGEVVTTARVTSLHETARGVFVTRESDSRDFASGQPMWKNRVVSYVRGGTTSLSGGAGATAEAPPVTASGSVEFVGRWQTRPDQALLYGLTGDTNPIHGSAAAANAAGLDRPILHGLCSFGGVVRLLVEGLAQGDETELAATSVVFHAPVHPGDALDVLSFERDGSGRRAFEAWVDGVRCLSGWVEL